MRRDFVDGVWHPKFSAWRVGLEMGDVAAILARETGSSHYREVALETFDTAIARHELGDGGLNYDAEMGPTTAPSQISTGAALVSLGTAYLELADRLTPSQRARWAAALRRAAMWLAGDIHYYVNGNINLQGTLGLYLAWLATGDKALYSAYRSAWNFTLKPGPKWPGRGLIYTKSATGPLAANGAGYLTEQGVGAPGFDPHYTVLQADYAAELYAVSHAHGALRLLDLLVDQLFTRINRGDTRNLLRRRDHDIPSNLEPARSYRPPFPCWHSLCGRIFCGTCPNRRGSLRAPSATGQRQGDDQDQVMGNYAMALIALQPTLGSQ